MRREEKKTDIEIVLTEGRNRQIRRMAAAVGHRVLKLQRVAIGKLNLGDLPVGAMRILDDQEIKSLLQN